MADQEFEGIGIRTTLGEDTQLRVVEPGQPVDVGPLLRAARLDVLILSFREEDEAVAVLKDIGRRTCPPAVVVLAHDVTPSGVQRLLLHGANGVLRHASASAHLVWAVRATAGGALALCPDLAAPVVDAYLKPARRRQRRTSAQRLIARLSPREREVLLHVVEGQSDAQIAIELSLSPYTVKDHLRSIRGKLGRDSRLGIARLAWQAGFEGDLTADGLESIGA
ncbi:response regulator transcription factor [Streptomyces chitinivorans]|uniref:response regulator transcription factor n=1 Tax=Streptomyces chitinivorans TaxID=1257027 RepID=UPI0031E957A2